MIDDDIHEMTMDGMTRNLQGSREEKGQALEGKGYKNRKLRGIAGPAYLLTFIPRRNRT